MSFCESFCQGLVIGYESCKKERNLLIFEKFIASGKHVSPEGRSNINALNLEKFSLRAKLSPPLLFEAQVFVCKAVNTAEHRDGRSCVV